MPRTPVSNDPRAPAPTNGVLRTPVAAEPSALQLAQACVARGWAPVALRPSTRRPVIRGFQRRLTDDEIAGHFNNGTPVDVGVVLGELSSGLVDVDLDAPEAVLLAPTFLPETGCRWGRTSRRNTHWAYSLTPLPPKGKSYEDRDTPGGEKAMLVELRIKGMAVCPGSQHPSGERIEWASDGSPAQVDVAALSTAVRHLAIASLLGRHWPAHGQRHQAALASSGVLLRAGLDEPTVTRIVVGAARAARDPEANERATDVRTTAEALSRNDQVTGGPTLAEVLRGDGEKVVRQLEGWLGADETRSGASTGGRRHETQCDQLLALTEDFELFVEEGGDAAYARVRVAEHHETWALESRGFKAWLRDRYYEAHHKAAHSDQLNEAVLQLEARAKYHGEHHVVDVRVGGNDEVIFLDLGNDAWQVVEITAEGWQIVADSPVRFRRPPGMLPLPPPVPGGSLDGLLEFINTGNDEDSKTLVLAFPVQALRPRGPFVAIEYIGEAGSAKSTATLVTKMLLDPSKASLRRVPRDERDLMIACKNSWVLGFNNLSSIPQWLSDALCSIATGGGFSTRALYSDTNEVLIDLARPFALNGIGSVVARGDLLQRTMTVTLPAISPDKRRTEAEFWSTFEAARPRLLGALCDAASVALRRKHEVRLPNLPRMADVAIWVTAASPALRWNERRFLEASARGQSAGHAEILADSPLVEPLRKMVKFATNGTWQGTASLLLERLNDRVSDNVKLLKSWPKTANHLGTELRRLMSALREHGPYIDFDNQRALGPARRQITVRHKAERTPVKTVEKTPVKTTERTPVKTVERTPVNA